MCLAFGNFTSSLPRHLDQCGLGARKSLIPTLLIPKQQHIFLQMFQYTILLRFWQILKEFDNGLDRR